MLKRKNKFLENMLNDTGSNWYVDRSFVIFSGKYTDAWPTKFD